MAWLALNSLFLHFPHSGTGRYVQHLVERRDRFGETDLIGAEAFPPGADAPATVLLRGPLDRRRALAKVWYEQIGFPGAARRSRVAHYPYFAAPLRPSIPTVVTVHDLVPLLRPEYRRTAAQRLYTTLVCRGLSRAARVLTDSSASAKDLLAHLQIPASRLQVIPLAPDPLFRPLEDSEQEWARSVRARLGLPDRFILYLGGLDRRKNVGRLLRAFATLRTEREIPHALAIIGRVREGDPLFYDPRPDLASLGIADAVRLLGGVGDAEVRALHGLTDAFVFPSLYEGFGLPPLEAMRCGAPVVCSNASSLPEVVGEAGLTFSPTDIRAIAEAIWSVVSDEDLRHELSRRGRERASEFTWDRTVELTAGAYREAVLGS